ncbi:MAG: hypothetical protein RLY30_1299 [Pseudomonadota bacterium]|jgi:hypothetical protein
MKVTVQSGDTLLALTRNALRESGRPVPEGFKKLMAAAQTIAEVNQIQNPDRIYPGQVIDFKPITQSASAPASVTAAAPEVASVVLEPTRAAGHRLLERMLDRAVAKGYVPPQEQAAVQRRILDMAKEHRFAPDDFARVALMESDGLNPRATNGNCHGVIQFCSGPDRGAASVGYGKNPERILKLSVLEQLELVDRYFEDTALGQFKPASLDNLYLTVLFPAARDERQLHKALPIPGPQARALHVGGNQESPITRASLRKGLIENAASRLTQFAMGGGNVLPISTGTWLASRHVN